MRSALFIGPICAAAFALATGSAAAQQDGGVDAPTLQKPRPNAPHAGSATLPNTGETLSDKLDRGGGVIKPPAGVDPEINAPPKDPNASANMPVIRPPQNPSRQSK